MNTKHYAFLASSFIAVAALTTVATHGQGPIPGRNVNMVAGTDKFTGDPYLQRQNDPSIAVSTL